MSGESPVVLVVDDNRAIANTYTAFLSDEYTVRTAYNGKEALSELDQSVDVVLLDRRMPEVSGDAVLDEIESRQLDCRVVMLTAVDPDFDIVDMGFDEYLVKPIEREELNEVVGEMLERATYDDNFRRFLSLVSKKARLEEEKSSAELEENFSELSGTVKVSDMEADADRDVPDIPGIDEGEDEDDD